MNDAQVACPQCGRVIGNLVEIDGIILLNVGGAVCRVFHGVCIQCGGEIHWSAPERGMSKLMSWYLYQD